MPEKREQRQLVESVEMTGSPLMVGQETNARIHDAVFDLQLAFDGYSAALSIFGEPSLFADDDERAIFFVNKTEGLARACSVFLRKMVLGTRYEPRLLDEAVCQTAGLTFARLHKIPTDRRLLTIVPLHILGGTMQIARAKDGKTELESSQTIHTGERRLEFLIEWPLLGMTNRVEQPTPQKPWQVRPDELFDLRARPRLSCSNWLGQQLVVFDGYGVALKDVISLVANTEGAHSPAPELLMQEGGDDALALKSRHVRILSCIRAFGMSYPHVITIESAMYVHDEVVQNRKIAFPRYASPEREAAWPSFTLDSPAFSPPDGQGWLGFGGGAIATNFSGLVSYSVRAPGRRRTSVTANRQQGDGLYGYRVL